MQRKVSNVITLRETTPDGTSKEMMFDNKAEALKTLREMLGAEMPENLRRQAERQALNDELRRAFRAGKSADSIGEALKNAGY